MNRGGPWVGRRSAPACQCGLIRLDVLRGQTLPGWEAGPRRARHGWNRLENLGQRRHRRRHELDRPVLIQQVPLFGNARLPGQNPAARPVVDRLVRFVRRRQRDVMPADVAGDGVRRRRVMPVPHDPPPRNEQPHLGIRQGVAVDRIAEQPGQHLRRLRPVDHAEKREVLIEVLIAVDDVLALGADQKRQVRGGVFVEQLVQLRTGEVTPEPAELAHLGLAVEHHHRHVVPLLKVPDRPVAALPSGEVQVLGLVGQQVPHRIDDRQRPVRHVAGRADRPDGVPPQAAQHGSPPARPAAVTRRHFPRGGGGQLGRRRRERPLVLRESSPAAGSPPSPAGSARWPPPPTRCSGTPTPVPGAPSRRSPTRATRIWRIRSRRRRGPLRSQASRMSGT